MPTPQTTRVVQQAAALKFRTAHTGTGVADDIRNGIGEHHKAFRLISNAGIVGVDSHGAGLVAVGLSLVNAVAVGQSIGPQVDVETLGLLCRSTQETEQEEGGKYLFHSF